MRRLMLPAALAVAVVAVIGVWAIASAGAQRPINGRITLLGGPTGACDAESIRIELAGGGTLAHLGRTEITSVNCAGGTLESGEAEITAGAATFVTADGSTITSTFTGHQEAPQGSLAGYTTTHTVTGGTGRFADAAGTWTISGTVDLSAGRLVGDASGWLSY